MVVNSATPESRAVPIVRSKRIVIESLQPRNAFAKTRTDFYFRQTGLYESGNLQYSKNTRREIQHLSSRWYNRKNGLSCCIRASEGLPVPRRASRWLWHVPTPSKHFTASAVTQIKRQGRISARNFRTNAVDIWQSPAYPVTMTLKRFDFHTYS